MDYVDFKLVVTVQKPLWHEYDVPIEGTDEVEHHKHLREWFRQEFIDLMSNARQSLNDLAILRYDVDYNSPEGEFRIDVNLYEYVLQDRWKELAELVDQVLHLSDQVVSVVITPHSPMSYHFYRHYIPKEFIANEGRVPYPILLQTTFRYATEASGGFISTQLSDHLKQRGLNIEVSNEFVITATK